MIKKMQEIYYKILNRNKLPSNDEVHNLKTRLARVSARTTVAAKEYSETIKRVKRNDITFKIGVVSGNVER